MHPGEEALEVISTVPPDPTDVLTCPRQKPPLCLAWSAQERQFIFTGKKESKKSAIKRTPAGALFYCSFFFSFFLFREA